MTGPEGNSEFCFPRKQNKSKFWKARWDSNDNIKPNLASWQRGGIKPPLTARSDHKVLEFLLK